MQDQLNADKCFAPVALLLRLLVLFFMIIYCSKGCVFGGGAFILTINQSIGGNVVEILKVFLNNGTCVGVRSWFWHQIISNTDNTHSISVWHTAWGPLLKYRSHCLPNTAFHSCENLLIKEMGTIKSFCRI